MKYVATLLFLFSALAMGAGPTVSCTPYQGASGVAPHGVVIDCTGTTEGGMTAHQVFNGLYYITNFGDTKLANDPNGANWKNGANKSWSKNLGLGPVVTHVYQTPGTYTARTCVSDGTYTNCVDNSISVIAATSGTTTFCASNNGDYAGCTGTDIAGSSFDSAVSTALASAPKVRLLFHPGQTFTSQNTANIGAVSDVTIGTFTPGSPAYIVPYSGSLPVVVTFSSSSASDIRIMDLDITGEGTGDTGDCFSNAAGGDLSYVTLLRITCKDAGAGFINQSGATPSTFYGSVIQESTFQSYNAQNSFFGRGVESALIGNIFGPATATAEHTVRLDPVRMFEIAHSTIYGPTNVQGKTSLTVRATGHVTGASADTTNDTIYVNLQDLVLPAQTVSRNTALQFDAASSTQCDWGSDVLLERSIIYPNIVDNSDYIITTGWRWITVRNNIFDLSQAPGTQTPTVIYMSNQQTDPPCTASGGDSTDTMPEPAYLFFDNNTIYSSQTANNLYGVLLDGTAPQGSTVTGIDHPYVRNNLVYAPNFSGTLYIPSTSGTITNTTYLTNTGQVQSMTYSPSFTDVANAPIGFRPSASSYAIGSGTSVFPDSGYDFLNCANNKSHVRMGAFEPFAEAQGYGVAGPN